MDVARGGGGAPSPKRLVGAWVPRPLTWLVRWVGQAVVMWYQVELMPSLGHRFWYTQPRPPYLTPLTSQRPPIERGLSTDSENNDQDDDVFDFHKDHVDISDNNNDAETKVATDYDTDEVLLRRHDDAPCDNEDEEDYLSVTDGDTTQGCTTTSIVTTVTDTPHDVTSTQDVSTACTESPVR